MSIDLTDSFRHLLNGINGTVVVGVQSLFAFRALPSYRHLHTAGTRMCMCLCAFAARNAKSMTVANGGNAIAGRRSVGFDSCRPAKVVFLCVVGHAGLSKTLA